MKTTLHYDPNDKLAFNSRILNPPYNHNTLNGMTQSYLVRCIKSQSIIPGHYTYHTLSLIRQVGVDDVYSDDEISLHKWSENLHLRSIGSISLKSLQTVILFLK